MLLGDNKLPILRRHSCRHLMIFWMFHPGKLNMRGATDLAQQRGQITPLVRPQGNRLEAALNLKLIAQG